MSSDSLRAGHGTTVVLLGARGAGKTRLLSAILERDAAVISNLPLQLSGAVPMGYCSHRVLLHGHLTAFENLKLAAASLGIRDWKQRLQALLPDYQVNGGGAPASSLPRGETRLLTLGLALIHDPPLLLVDDLTRGLSRPMQRTLWQEILRLQRRSARLILYATNDLEATRVLADEVWVVSAGAVIARRLTTEIRPALLSLETVALTMKTPRDAARTLPRLQALGAYHARLRDDGRTIDVVIRRERLTILDLATVAGAALQSFAAAQTGLELLPEGWLMEVVHAAATSATGSPLPSYTLSDDRRRDEPANAFSLQTVYLLALSTWRRFFRNPVRIIWPFACHIVLLSLLLALDLWKRQGRLPDLAILIPAMMIVAAAPALFLGRATVLYWTRTAEMETLFSAARPPGPEQSHTFLTRYGLLVRNQRTFLSGLTLGLLAILVLHTALFHPLWILLLLQWAAPLHYVPAGLFLWIVLALLFLLPALWRLRIEGVR